MAYKSVLEDAKHEKVLEADTRYAKIDERLDQGAIPNSVWDGLLKNYLLQTWKGMLLCKGVTEIGIYPMLLQELKPKTIIELGAFHGGCAVWLADHLDMFGIEGTVYSLDIDLSLLHEVARQDKRIHFIEGDANQIDQALPTDLLSTLAHPWLVIEDVPAVDVVGLLDYFHEHGLQPDDYMIIEDTNTALWDIWEDSWEGKDELIMGRQKMNKLRAWLTAHSEEYVIDTFYLDMYGYNASKNWNSVLKRV